MAKRIATRPDWLKCTQVEEVLSASSCVSHDFADWINYWRHNGYWCFDRPEIISEVAKAHGIDLHRCRWFYYEGYEQAFDDQLRAWIDYSPEESFATSVQAPTNRTLRGYDVVTYSCGNSSECSPLSCNHMAEQIETNSHCLLDSFEVAHELTTQGKFADCEPGPYRILAVYEVPSP